MSEACESIRTIDQRWMSPPPVAGVDLMHAFNFIPVKDVGVDFLYDRYTASNIFYRSGSRPKLEAIVKRVIAGCKDELSKVKALARYIPEELPWAGVYTKRTGKPLPGDRDMSEEELIESGFGWCNEQSRVFCCLAQIAGVPSRMVFAGSDKGWGHVTSEVLLESGWMLVDQTMGFCFEKDGQAVRAVDVYGDEQIREYFAQPYKEAVLAARETIAKETVGGLLAADIPIECFMIIGIHNHFIF